MARSLREKSQLIAIISGVTSLIVVPIGIYGLYECYHSMGEIQNNNDTFKNYGGTHGIGTCAMFIVVMEIIHCFCCYKMYCWAKQDDALCVRIWLRSSIILCCIYGVLGIYGAILLFAADAIGPAVGAVIALIIIIPTKIISTWVVLIMVKLYLVAGAEARTSL